MKKGLLLPIIVTCAIIVIGLIINAVHMISQKRFEKLTVTYQGNKMEYSDIKAEDIYVVGNTTFWIVGINPDHIVLNSSDYIYENESYINEFKIEMNNTKTICFDEKNCVYFDLV